MLYRESPFILFENASIWQPPNSKDFTKQDKENERKNKDIIDRSSIESTYTKLSCKSIISFDLLLYFVWFVNILFCVLVVK